MASTLPALTVTCLHDARNHTQRLECEDAQPTQSLQRGSGAESQRLGKGPGGTACIDRRMPADFKHQSTQGHSVWVIRCISVTRGPADPSITKRSSHRIQALRPNHRASALPALVVICLTADIMQQMVHEVTTCDTQALRGQADSMHPTINPSYRTSLPRLCQHRDHTHTPPSPYKMFWGCQLHQQGDTSIAAAIHFKTSRFVCHIRTHANRL